MRLLLMILTAGLVVAQVSQVEAAVAGKKAKASKAAKAKKAQGELSTSHDFNDQSVIGEYQMPDEALAKVENEKLLSDLLGVRKHFKDRLSKASEQE